MRKTVLGVVSAAALLLSSAPAVATSITRVDGDHFAASGLRLANQGCLDPGTQPTRTPAFKVAKGPRKPPLGSRSIGWSPHVAQYGIGPTTHVDSPSTMSDLHIRLYSKSSQASGQAVVNYTPAGDAGVWRGRSALGTDQSVGWHAVAIAPDATYQWRHFDADGVADQDAANATLADFVNAHGGDGDGAYVGLAFGCDGHTFFVDGLSVKTADGRETYDFEGYATRTTLTTGGEKQKSVTITYGQPVGFTAHLRGKVGDVRHAGTLRIDSKAESAKSWSKLDNRKVGDSGNERVRIHPARGTSYRASYAGTTAWEGSTSNALWIRVRSLLHAAIADATVTKGKPFVTAGRFQPNRVAPVKLQRFVHKKWTTVKSIRSTREGRFRFSVPAQPVGVSYWRVQVAPGHGNLGAHTAAMKLTVKAPPTSPPPPPSDPPPPPPEDPPPPPPPTH